MFSAPYAAFNPAGQAFIRSYLQGVQFARNDGLPEDWTSLGDWEGTYHETEGEEGGTEEGATEGGGETPEDGAEKEQAGEEEEPEKEEEEEEGEAGESDGEDGDKAPKKQNQRRPGNRAREATPTRGGKSSPSKKAKVEIPKVGEPISISPVFILHPDNEACQQQEEKTKTQCKALHSAIEFVLLSRAGFSNLSKQLQDLAWRVLLEGLEWTTKGKRSSQDAPSHRTAVLVDQTLTVKDVMGTLKRETAAWEDEHKPTGDQVEIAAKAIHYIATAREQEPLRAQFAKVAFLLLGCTLPEK